MIVNPKTPVDRLLWAFHYGHHWNPAFQNLRNLDESSVLKMTGSEQDAKDLIASWQLADANVGDLVKSIHGRRLRPDGDVGPASEAVMSFQRCPLPDFPPPVGATFHYDDPQLQAAVEKMQAATGSGSVPVGCYGTAGVHEVKASYDISRLSSSQKEWWPEINRRHKEECAAMGLRIIEVEVGEATNVEFYGRNFTGGTIGMAQFLGSSCGAEAFCTISPAYDPDLEMVLILDMHEHGHCWNCNHRPGYIMNPSIRRVKPKWVERDASGTIIYTDPSYTADLRGFFGGGPLAPQTPPPDVPIPPTLTLIAEFQITSTGTYVLAKKTGGTVPTGPQPT